MQEPLSSNKALVPYYKTSIVPPDVTSRIKRESKTINAKIYEHFAFIQNKKQMGFVAIGAITIFVSLTLHIIVGLILGAILVALGTTILFPEKLEGYEGARMNFVRDVSRTTFHCPHCSHGFNAAAAWHCGNCGNLHEQTKENNYKYSSPFIECHSVGCSKRQQVAIQCPNIKCSRHILLDHQTYLENQSYNTPYLGVARFKGDNNQPQVPENFNTSAFTDIFS